MAKRGRQTCKYGVALFETLGEDDLNRNVLIEVGSMLMTGRRCALLRDSNAAPMPTDLIGQVRKDVDFADLDATRETLHLWMALRGLARDRRATA